MSIRLKEAEERINALAQSMNDLLSVLTSELPATHPALESFNRNLADAESQINVYKKSMVEQQAPLDNGDRHNAFFSFWDLKIALKIYDEYLTQVDPHGKIYDPGQRGVAPGYFGSPNPKTFKCGDFQRRSMQRPVQTAIATFHERGNAYQETVHLPISGETIEWSDDVGGKFEYRRLLQYFNKLIDEYNDFVDGEKALTHPVDDRRTLEKRLCTALDDVVSMNREHELQQEAGSISLQKYVDQKTSFNVVLEYIGNNEWGNQLRVGMSLYYIQNEEVIVSEKRQFNESIRGGFQPDAHSSHSTTPCGFSHSILNDYMVSQLMNAMVRYLYHREISTVHTFTRDRGELICHSHELEKLPIEEESEEESGEGSDEEPTSDE